MMLHDLRFRGIGPFSDEQHIDFEALGQAGMFLLEGPTGVGKSTIIDAIVFALYGGVASQEADDGRLVSHFRQPDQEPYVEMVFSTAQGAFRVRRSPAHWRPKAKAKNGEDLTHQNATATLMKLAHPGDADGTPIGSRPSEVGPAIRDAVGLDKEQFVSTIVLPQGQFATFLRAGSKDRQPVLQKIFRTHQYEKLQQRLKEAGRAADAKRKAAQDAVATALDTFRGAVSAMDESALAGVEPQSPGDDIRASVASAVDGLNGSRAAAATARDDAMARHADAKTALEAVDTRIQRRDDLAGARKRREQLDAREPAIAAQRIALGDDERAARVADAVTRAGAADTERAAARQALKAALAAAPEALAELPVLDLEENAKQGRRTAGALSTLLDDERSLPAKETKAAGLETMAADRAAQERGLQEQISALPELLDDARERLTGQQMLAESADRLNADLTAVRNRARAAEKLVAAKAEACAIDARIEDLVAVLSTADAEAVRTTDGYRAGIAATIGSTLLPGQPCPACGSVDHPNPALPGDDHVTVADVDAATERAARARGDVETARRSRGKQDLLLTELATTAAGLTVEEAEIRIEALRAELAAARGAADEAKATAASIADLESQSSRLAEQVKDARQQHTQASATAAAIRAEIAASRQRIEAELQGFASVADRVADLESRVATCDVLVGRHRELASAARAADLAGASLAEALERENFADAAAATAARITDAARQAAESAIRTHEQEAVLVAAALDRDDLAGVDPDEVIDRAPVATALSAAIVEYDERLRAFNEISQVVRQAESLAVRIAKSVDDREMVVADTETALLLARLAEGKNALGIDLATFVLVHRFRSVIEAANLHLTQMSNGRLILESFEEAEKKSAKAGLGIRVRDLHTESVRTPKTLSGGETFYASLSLALGLAEIVTAESGGVELDTLFVDEGFGSLDPETLDKVMAVLDGLQRNGRVLGLVSHVTEMKERIAERVEVRRVSESGPSTLRVVA